MVFERKEEEVIDFNIAYRVRLPGEGDGGGGVPRREGGRKPFKI